VPIPLLLSAEGIQAGEWSPDGKYFYYSQQGATGEPGPNMAEVTLSFLDARSGETCEGIRETVKVVTGDGGSTLTAPA
jgi:hypothetical protein